NPSGAWSLRWMLPSALDMLGHRLGKRPNLIKHLTREDDSGLADRQHSDAQRRRRPGIARMSEIIRFGRGVKATLREGTGADPARHPLLVLRQVAPQQLRQPLDAIARYRERK